MKLNFRILVLAVGLVTGLMTVSAQDVQIQMNQKIATLPTTASSYLDDPFRYFNVMIIVTGAGSEGLDIFCDINFTSNSSSIYGRTKSGTVPAEYIIST